jgi:hypothetical protein
MSAICEIDQTLSDLFSKTNVQIVLGDNLFLKDPKMLSPSGCRFDVMDWLHRSTLMLASAISKNDPTLAHEVYAMALASLQFLGSDHTIPSSLFMKPSGFFQDEAKFLHLNLMKSLYIIFDERRFLPIIEATQIDELKELSAFCSATLLFFKEHHLPKWDIKEQKAPHINLHNFSTPDTTFLFNCFGFGSSMGFFAKNGIEIRAFGPQSVLGDMDTFGCFRIDGDPTLVIDQELSQTDQETTLKGWTRLGHASSDFMHVDLSKGKETAFKIRLVTLEGSKYFFTFFIKADCLKTASGTTLFKKSLNSYRGPSETVSVFSEEKELQIVTDKTSMVLVPLEGKSHFWGADYLVAFEIVDSMDGFKCIIK